MSPDDQLTPEGEEPGPGEPSEGGSPETPAQGGGLGAPGIAARSQCVQRAGGGARGCIHPCRRAAALSSPAAQVSGGGPAHPGERVRLPESPPGPPAGEGGAEYGPGRGPTERPGAGDGIGSAGGNHRSAAGDHQGPQVRGEFQDTRRDVHRLQGDPKRLPNVRVPGPVYEHSAAPGPGLPGALQVKLRWPGELLGGAAGAGGLPRGRLQSDRPYRGFR